MEERERERENRERENRERKNERDRKDDAVPAMVVWSHPHSIVHTNYTIGSPKKSNPSDWEKWNPKPYTYVIHTENRLFRSPEFPYAVLIKC